MNFVREDLFRMPWSKTDNPGAWIEVTDVCNLNCPGCFRKNSLEGHKALKDIKEDILFSLKSTNCSRICISGGEPLMHPDIIEVVKFISALKLKPIILSNGELLTTGLISELKKAGLYQFYLHVDANQGRPGWTGKTESGMNELRQYYAGLLHKGKIKCGFNITIRHSNLGDVKDIVGWFRKNISKVSHLSLIAFRGIPRYEGYEMVADGQRVDPKLFSNNVKNMDEIDISTMDIYNMLSESFSNVYPCSYLPGTSRLDTYKMLIINNIGSDSVIYGEMGGKTIQFYQFMVHLIFGKYDATVPSAGKTVFLLSVFDKHIRKAFAKYLKAVAMNPMRLFDGIHVQSMVLQQPFEMIDREANLCDGCVNLMPYKGRMINSCRLDEYRLAGGPVNFRKI
ncbi:MAG: radical SAM protein [Bacteroidota bacterium]